MNFLVFETLGHWARIVTQTQYFKNKHASIAEKNECKNSTERIRLSTFKASTIIGRRLFKQEIKIVKRIVIIKADKGIVVHHRFI